MLISKNYILIKLEQVNSGQKSDAENHCLTVFSVSMQIFTAKAQYLSLSLVRVRAHIQHAGKRG